MKKQLWYQLNEDKTISTLPDGAYPNFRDESRRVAKDSINDIEISTVFLCLDHSYGEDGPPILFETMIFGGENDGWMKRYCTYDEALEGHNIVVGCIKNNKPL
jgi:hypothetical protein